MFSFQRHIHQFEAYNPMVINDGQNIIILIIATMQSWDIIYMIFQKRPHLMEHHAVLMIFPCLKLRALSQKGFPGTQILRQIHLALLDMCDDSTTVFKCLIVKPWKFHKFLVIVYDYRTRYFQLYHSVDVIL